APTSRPCVRTKLVVIMSAMCRTSCAPSITSTLDGSVCAWASVAPDRPIAITSATQRTTECSALRCQTPLVASDSRSRAGEDERDAARDRRDADDRRERNVVMFLAGRFDRTEIEDLLARGVADAADGERDDAEDNQENTDELHVHLQGPARPDNVDVL